MSAAAEIHAELVAAARWRLLALGLGGADVATLGDLRSLAEGLLDGGLESGLLAAVRSSLDDAAPADLAADFDALFGVEGTCQAYEGSYERDPIRQSRQMADAAGFYRAFGAEAGGREAERPDHAGCQLEFLSFLALRRAGALEEGDAEGAEICRSAADGFLADHLLRWLPALARDVEAAAATPFYAALARLAADGAEEEAARRGVEIPPQPVRRERSNRDERLECGAVTLR